MELTLAHTGRRRFTRTLVALGASVLAIGVSAGCGGGGNAFSQATSSGSTAATASSGSGGSGGSGKTVTVGGANFTEQLLLTQIYSQALQGAGYTTKVQNVDSREIYLQALRAGQIDVVPEYAATLTSNLADSLKAPGTPSADIAKTVATLRPLAAKAGITVLEPSKATDQNTFVVSQDYATKNNLKTLSDLGKLGKPIKIAAGAECKTRPFCAPGLKKTYNITATVDPTGSGTAPSFQAVKNGTDQLALAFTSDGTYKSFGLVELADDKKLQASDNIVGVVNTKTVGSDPKLVDTINKVDQALTTADLQTLNGRVGTNREEPAAVAKDWLTRHSLG